MKKYFGLLVILLISFSAAFAQKGKVNAAYNLIIAGELEKAKERLDLAVVHEKSKDWPKTYYVMGKFYHSVYLSDKTELKSKYENALDLAYENYKRASGMDTLDKLKNFMEVDIIDFYSKLYSAGVEQYEKEKYDIAAKYWIYAISSRKFSSLYKDVADSSLIFNVGIAAYFGKDYDMAIDYFTQSTNLNYGGANAFVYIKNSYLEKGDTATALGFLQQGFNKYPEDQNILIELINYYLTTGGSEKALEYLALAKEQDPSNPTFYHAEGTLYDKMGNIDKAIECYNKAIEIDQEYFNSYYNLGVIYFNRGVVLADSANMTLNDKVYEKLKKEADHKFEETVPIFEKCLELRPDDRETMDNLKILYYRLQMTEKHEEMKKRLDALPAQSQNNELMQ